MRRPMMLAGAFGQLARLLLAILCIGPIAMWAEQARADAWPELQRITTDQGCIAYIIDYNDPGEPGNWRVYHWTGQCSPGAEISGKGALQTHYMEYGTATVDVVAGTMIGGYFQGPATESFFDVDAQGRWDSRQPSDTPLALQFNRGCRSDNDNCDSLRSELVNITVYRQAPFRDVNPAASIAAARTPGDPVQIPREAHGFVNSCIVLKTPPEDRSPGAWSANTWSVSNQCGFAVRVSWCIAEPPAASANANLCSRGKAITTEIPAYNGQLFESVAPTDSLSIRSFACKVPAEPGMQANPRDLAFDDNGNLTSSGCP